MKTAAMERARYRTARIVERVTLSYFYKREGDDEWCEHLEAGTAERTRIRGLVSYTPDNPAARPMNSVYEGSLLIDELVMLPSE